MPRALLIALVIALTSTRAAFGTGQKTPAPSTITVDFVVTDESKAPVLDLKPEEITLKIAGRDARVHSLELIKVGSGNTPEPPEATTPEGLPAPYGETAPARTDTNRNIVLLLDEGTLFGLDEIVKKSVAALLDSLDPADRVALVSTRPDGVNTNFTTSRDTITQAIESTVLGRGNTALCVAGVLEQVRSLAETLPTGRTTTIALISRGAGSATSPLSQGPAVSTAGGCVFRRDQLAPVEEAVSAAQINYHVFHVGNAGLSPNLDNLAGSTGAVTGILSFTDASGLARAVTDSAVFYRAVVDAPPPGRTYQRAEFRVTRPNVRVQAPKFLAAPKPAPPAGEAAALLRGDISRADLPLRVTAFPSRNDNESMPLKLVVIVEPGDPGVPLYSAMLVVTAADGGIAGQWTARRTDLQRPPLVAAVPVNEGVYRIRAAAVDEKGRGGIAEYTVSAALAGDGPVKLSALALGVNSPNGFVPRLLFSKEPEAMAYLEIYGVPADAQVSVSFELAPDADAPATASVAGSVRGSGSARYATGLLPLGSVPSGDTLVRARVMVNGAPTGTVVRTLRKAGQ